MQSACSLYRQRAWIYVILVSLISALFVGAKTPDAAAAEPADAMAAFVRGTDNAVYWNYLQAGSGWTGWSSLGGFVTSDPAATSWGAGNFAVFARGTDNQIWWNRREGTAWTGWQAVGGYATSGPAVASTGAGRIDLVVRGIDNGLYHNRYVHGSGWTGFAPVGGTASSDPALVATDGGRLDLVVRGIDGATMWHNVWNGSEWIGFAPVPGGVATSAPALSSATAGVVDLFVRGTDNGLYLAHYSIDGGWMPWQALGGVLSGKPAATSWGPDVREVMVRGNDDASLFINEYRTGSWSGFSFMTGAYATSAPALAAWYTPPAPSPPPPPQTNCANVTGPVDITQTVIASGIRVHACLGPAVSAMVSAANTAGVNLSGGGWRSIESQIALRRQHCGTSYYDVWQRPSNQCNPPTAIPGTSRHERGLAIDFSNCSSHSTACWQWLNANAAQYHLYNLASEPWHWSYDGH